MRNSAQHQGCVALVRLLAYATALSSLSPTASALHHMRAISVPKRDTSANVTEADGIPLIVNNQCREDIYPGLVTQGGVGPGTNGFKLAPGENKTLLVSKDWQGRIWGRTNCSFSEDGKTSASGSGPACLTGNCGPIDCTGSGENPVTLAEFTLDGSDSQSFYDISLVDGYNIPMAIVMHPGENKTLEDIPPNLTNPSCIGTFDLLSPAPYNPYTDSQEFLGTNESFPLPFLGSSPTSHEVSRWCPWDLQVSPPKKPGDGVYPYPDDNIKRPGFNPCLSACAKWNKPSDCCTGSYNDPNKCKPSLYSKGAKKVCPDAYSFAYDDHKSTFIIPTGAGFEVVLCPPGRSTDILSKQAAANEVLKQNAHPTSLNISALPSSTGTKIAETNGLTFLMTLTFVISTSVWWGL